VCMESDVDWIEDDLDSPESRKVALDVDCEHNWKISSVVEDFQGALGDHNRSIFHLAHEFLELSWTDVLIDKTLIHARVPNMTVELDVCSFCAPWELCNLKRKRELNE